MAASVIHPMAHQHNHPITNYNRAFSIGISLNLVFVGIEAGYGFSVNSLALISDAGHNLSDVFSLGFAWAASWLAAKSPTLKRTYGFRRATILASLFSAILLILVLGSIVWEAIGRFQHPAAVNTNTVIIVAGIGIVINTFTALLFLSGREKDLNIKGAFLHMASDAAVSLGVVISAFVMQQEGWLWLDPAISIVIAIIIFWSTWALFCDSLNLSLDAVPRHINASEVEDYLLSIEVVDSLHDLHIWAMSTTEVALTVHLIVPQQNNDELIHQLAENLHQQFAIAHCTIQLEHGDADNCLQSHPDSL